jgi:hypothetical protein
METKDDAVSAPAEEKTSEVRSLTRDKSECRK